MIARIPTALEGCSKLPMIIENRPVSHEGSGSVFLYREAKLLQIRRQGEMVSAGLYTELPVNGIKRLVNGYLFTRNE